MIDSLPLHGGQLHHIAERFGICRDQLLDFSANINPEGPSAEVLSTLHACLEDRSTLTCYPDIEHTEFKQSISRYADVESRNISIANGFVPLLDACLRALPIRRCLLPVPAFLEYRQTLARAQIEITPYVLRPESGFRYDTLAMLDDRPDAILLANPQNPSGIIGNREEILQIVANAAKQNVYVLLDEAFIDYRPECSATSFVNQFTNLIVFRSVTKFYSIPGLRIAYAVAGAEVTQLIHDNLPPWPVSTLATHAVCAALKDDTYASRARLLNRERRTHLQSRMKALGIHAYPSDANFLLLRLPSSIDPATFWQRMIIDHHIVLRSCANYESLPAEHIRTAVRTDQENVRLIEATACVLRSLRCVGEADISDDSRSAPLPDAVQHD